VNDLAAGFVRGPITVALEADVVFGTVNANRRHYDAAAALAADRSWLALLIRERQPGPDGQS
jgi:glucose 1-dehydrogenase